MANVIRKVAGHEFGISNSWLATKFTLIKLSCGHYADWSRDGHDNTNLPTEYECSECGDIEAKHRQLKQWIDSGIVAHTRAHPRYDTCGNVLYYDVLIYGIDSTSPTGVLLLGGVPDIPEFQDLLHDTLSPLSPNDR
jgi:hypothetical protein